MTREDDSHAYIAAIPSSGATQTQPTASAPTNTPIRARASGFGNLSYFLQGRYHDLSGDGRNISESNDEIPMAEVPPGDSFNSTHYATNPGESRSNSDAELLAATMELRGEMRDAVECDFNWTGPGGRTVWEGSARLEDPSNRGGQYWGDVFFATWVGRDFSQSDGAEVVETGTHTVEFDTNYGTYSRDFDVVGPSVTSCSVPSEVPRNESADVSATVSNDGSGSYNGEVRWVRDGDRRDVLATDTFNVGPNGVDTVSGTISARDVLPDEDIAAYCLL